MIEYKPLTPSLRSDINIAFDEQIEELKTCKPNALVNMQIEELRMYKRLISGLPDGYPMPINKCGEGMVIKKIKSKKNRVVFYFGKADEMYGLFGGIQYYERFDWNHIMLGITLLKWYITLEFRWRVANCGYPKGEVYTD